MDVAIIGASGDIGREIVAQLLGERVLSVSERLQLVGRAEGASASKLFGMRTDLSDAYAEIAPELDIALQPSEIVADVIVMSAGVTVKGQATSRQALAQENLPLFHTYAQAIEKYGHGHEIILVVTNPVELAVEVFSQYLGRHRVIGIGAYSDSLRFRREIANALGVRRQLIQGFVIGEHGDSMVPLWSSVRIHGMDNEEMVSTISRLRGEPTISQFPAQVSCAKQTVMDYLSSGQVREAFEYVDRLPPDLRVVLRPYVTHTSGAKTAAATANVTVDLVRTLLDGREIVVSGQVRLEGEFYDIHTSLGVPIVVSTQGWTQVVPLQLWADEAQLLLQIADNVGSKIKEWIQHDPGAMGVCG
jgi:malate dehydrogenase